MSHEQISDIELVKPTQLHKDEVLAYKKEFAVDDEYISGSASLGSADSFESWLANVNAEADLDGPEGELVPATQLLAIRKSDKKLIGMVSIRHELNDYLKEYGGHVGYSVRKSERRRGYATQMLKLALAYCRSLGISKTLLTCDKQNIGSATVIKANGGILENEVVRDSNGAITQRYWINL
jgi:predicted acetyltransferase